MLRPISSREAGLAGKRVLVTGAGGFIGSHLTERLLAAGCKVRALVRYGSRNHLGYLESLEHAGLEVMAGDVRDAALMRTAVKGCFAVFHLAALIAIPYSYSAPQSYLDVNAGGTLNLLLASRDEGVQRFLQTSTSEVYGSAQKLPMDELHPLRPQSPYAATKVASDQLALSFYYSYGTPVTVVRPFNTYGPRQSLRAILPTLCLQALEKDILHLGNLESRRDLTYVEDTCAGFLHAAVAPAAIGEVVNLGFGENHSVSELVELVGRLRGKSLSVEVEERRLRPPASEVDQLLSDYGKAREMLDWRPEISLEQGVLCLMSWLEQQKGAYRDSYAL